MKHEYFKVYNVTGIRQNYFLLNSMNPGNIDKKLYAFLKNFQRIRGDMVFDVLTWFRR